MQLKDDVSTVVAALILTAVVVTLLVVFDAGVVTALVNTIAYAWRVLT